MLYVCDKKYRMSRAFVFDKIDLDKGLLVVSWIVTIGKKSFCIQIFKYF